VISPGRSDERFAGLVGCFVDMRPILIDAGATDSLDRLAGKVTDAGWFARDCQAPGSAFLDEPDLPVPRWGFNYRSHLPSPREFSLPGVSARFETARTLFSGIDLAELGLSVAPLSDPRGRAVYQNLFELYLGIDEVDGELRCTFSSLENLVFEDPRVEDVIREFGSQLEALTSRALD
jgi:hypothetical protein